MALRWGTAGVEKVGGTTGIGIETVSPGRRQGLYVGEVQTKEQKIGQQNCQTTTTGSVTAVTMRIHRLLYWSQLDKRYHT